MTTEKIANRLVELCRQGQNALAQVELYDDDIESIESQATRYRKTRGIKKVQRKTAMFYEMAQEIHKYELSDPLIIDDHFCFKLSVDVTVRGLGRVQLDELCVYHVKDEKIIKEEFFYTPNATAE
ncbi:SnoaL-like domain-containing protein [Wenyingzhuangia sp. IMCC45533]